MTPTFLIGFRCLRCGTLHPSTDTATLTYTCPIDGGNLDAIYDYARIGSEANAARLSSSRDRSIWHYAPFLPIRSAELRAAAGLDDPSLSTPLTALGWSPLYRAPQLERALDVRRIWLKDDSRLPSSSFKDRASAMVVAHALRCAQRTICVASTGNAAGALAAMCAGLAQVRAVVFVPNGTPEGKLAGILIHGAQVFMVDGSYNDAVDMANAACAEFGWYNRSTGINPYTREGKKTAGFEIAEQLGAVAGRPFSAPDVMIVPTGDGNILSGVQKGFRELLAVGWIERMPRFIGVTATLAPSLFRAWRDGSDTPQPHPSTTIASGISVDLPCDGLAALQAVRSSGGAFVEVSDEAMLDSMGTLARDAGVFVEPACAAAHAGLSAARAQGLVGATDEVVLQLTGSGFKDIKNAVRAVQQPTPVATLHDVRRAINVT
jgi:threonine synthase